MAANKILLTMAFAMGLVMCIQGLTISRDKKNYHFGKHKRGDVTLLKDQPVKEGRHLDHHDETATFVLGIPDEKLKTKLKNKDPAYIPKISEIIVTDQGGGSKDCTIANGGLGRSHVTLKFKSHSLGGKLNYLVTLKGQ